MIKIVRPVVKKGLVNLICLNGKKCLPLKASGIQALWCHQMHYWLAYSRPVQTSQECNRCRHKACIPNARAPHVVQDGFLDFIYKGLLALWRHLIVLLGIAYSKSGQTNQTWSRQDNSAIDGTTWREYPTPQYEPYRHEVHLGWHFLTGTRTARFYSGGVVLHSIGPLHFEPLQV